MPHYPRTAGSPTGAKPQVIVRAVRDFWRLRLHMWVNRGARSLRRGRRRIRRPTSAGSIRRSAAAGPRRPGRTSSEFTKSRKTSSRGSTQPLAGRLEASSRARPPRRRARRRPRAPACSRTAVGGEDPDPGADRQRQRVGWPRIDLDRLARPARRTAGRGRSRRRASEMTTRSTRTPSSSRVVANRSWVSGRSGVRPWSFIAIALASHGPIQIGQVAVALGLLEDDHVAVRQHVDAHALDDHLDQLVVGHAPDYPTVGRGRRPARARDRA